VNGRLYKAGSTRTYSTRHYFSDYTETHTHQPTPKTRVCNNVRGGSIWRWCFNVQRLQLPIIMVAGGEQKQPQVQTYTGRTYLICGTIHETSRSIMIASNNSILWPTTCFVNCHNTGPSSSYIFHGVGPLVDPFRSHVSRSFFKGLPWFLLPVGE